MNLQELKQKNPAELINEAEKLGIENPSTLRKQEILFAILKKLAEKKEQITATGVLELVFVPSPSCPSLLSPQQATEPSSRIAQE